MFNTFAFRLSGKMRRRVSLAVFLTAAAVPAFGQDRSTLYAPPSPYSSWDLLAATSTGSLDKSAIEQLNKRLETAVMMGDVATIVAMHTDDALILPAMLKGKKAIGDDWTKTFKQNIRIENVKDIITDVRPLASDVVLEIGNSSSTWIIPGVPPQNISDSYATIWQKVGGEWKVNTAISIEAPSNVAAQNNDQLSQLDRQEQQRPGDTQAQAGLNICNDASIPLTAAIAYSKDNGWESSGWYSIGPKECKQLISSDLRGRSYWIYAESTWKSLVWNGDGKANSGYFCVSKKAFNFHIDKDTKCAEGKTFNMIDTGQNVGMTYRLGQEHLDPRQVVDDEIVAHRNFERNQQLLEDIISEQQKRHYESMQNIIKGFGPCYGCYPR